MEIVQILTKITPFFATFCFFVSDSDLYILKQFYKPSCFLTKVSILFHAATKM